MRFPFLVLAFLLLITACDSNDDPDPVEITQIVFEAGQQRVYTRESILITNDFEGNEIDRAEEQETFVVERSSNPDPVPGIENTIQLDIYPAESPDLVSSVWYTQSESQLVYVATRSFSPFIVLKTGGHPVLNPFFPEMSGQDVASGPDEIFVLDPPRIALQFPLEAGRSWTALMRDDFLITSEVLEQEILSVEGGRFSCQVVRSLNGFVDDPVEYTDYITTDGLVKRVGRREGPGRDSQNNPAFTIFEQTVELVEIRD